MAFAMIAPLRRRMMRHRSVNAVFSLFLALMQLISVPGTYAAAHSFTISNTAVITHQVSGNVQTVPTNTVTTQVTLRTPSTIEFLQYAPNAPVTESVPVHSTEFDDGGDGDFQPLTPPFVFGTEIAINATLPLVVATQYHIGETHLHQSHRFRSKHR